MQNVVFEGFADNVDTYVFMSARAENFSVAAKAAGMVNTPVTRTDRSRIYMSKMYFGASTISNSGSAPTTAEPLLPVHLVG